MTEIRLAESSGTKVLVSRPAARILLPRIESALQANANELIFDFEGIRVVAPSFLDELLLLTEKVAAFPPEGVRKTKIVLRHYPPGMDATLGAIGHAHDAEVILDDKGSWIFTRSA